ncbi:hypothetical protein, partial [Rhizobium grahamii]|uniref:hypothetical protein n=1 Tax=Rhizobium grahamii TaxID=1120045 RepID=UPI001AECFF62
RRQNLKGTSLIHTVAHRFLRMIHAENERSFDTALRGMAYPLTNQFCSDSLMLAGWRPAFDDRTYIERSSRARCCRRAEWRKRSFSGDAV